MKSARIAAFGAAWFGVFTLNAFADIRWDIPASTPSTDDPREDLIGSSVAVSGDVAVIGAPGTFEEGIVYVYRRGASGWTPEAILTTDVPSFYHRIFGLEVDVDGDTIVVNDPLFGDEEYSHLGLVHVFVYDPASLSWTLQAVLSPPNPETNLSFGFSISLDGDQLAVGAPGRQTVYIYSRTGGTWTLRARLGTSLATSLGFGGAVSLRGGDLLVGDAGDDASGSGAGAVHVYRRSGTIWQREGVLRPSDARPQHYFGVDVDTLGNTAFVGTSAADQERVYVFERVGTVWTETSQLVSSDYQFDDSFGTSLEASGTRLLVGAPRRDAAYVFENVAGAWMETVQLLSSAPPQDSFGEAVALDGERAVVGGSRLDGLVNRSGAAFAFEPAGASWAQTAQFQGIDRTAGEGFGESIAAYCGQYNMSMAVSAPNDGLTGVVHLLNVDGDNVYPQARLVPADGIPSDHFGQAVSLWQSWVLVGAPGALAGMGKVYLFAYTFQGWTPLGFLTAPDGAPGDGFGSALANDLQRAFVGAPFDDAEAGAVYVFRRQGTTWTQTSKLTASDASSLSRFGATLSLFGNRLVIGAPADDERGQDAGAIYVFDYDGQLWVESAKLLAQDGEAGDGLGSSVALHGDHVAAGAPFDQEGSESLGSAYCFSLGGVGWSQAQKLYASDGAHGDRFGAQVGLTEQLLIVSAPEHDGHGAFYPFSRRIQPAWIEEIHFPYYPGQPGSRFGEALVVLDPFAGCSSSYVDSDARVVVGLPSLDWISADSGIVQVYDLGSSLPQYCTAKTNSLGCLPFISRSGSPSASSSYPHHVMAENLVPGQVGMLLYSTKGTSSTDFHGGKLCIGPFRRLLPAKAAKADGSLPCRGTLTRDFNAHVRSGNDPELIPGATVYAQWIARDPDDPLGFGDSLTDAIQFTILP